MITKYQNALATIPAPGGGCHTALLAVANRGILAGLSTDRIFDDIRRAIPAGGRRVPDREIREAIEKASRECQPVGPRREFTPAEKQAYAKRKQAEKARRAVEQRKAETVFSVIDKITPCDPADIWERSPIRLTGDTADDTALLLESSYRPGELVWCGATHDKHRPKSIDAWLSQWKVGQALPNFIICNPLDGHQHETSSGTRSYRCDRAVASHRFCLVEFDELSLEEQAGRICWMLDKELPVSAVIHSGGKSFHTWLKVDMPDAKAWQREIYNGIFKRYLIPMGADRACRNAARLSRLPGAIREKDGKRTMQTLWYLNAGHE